MGKKSLLAVLVIMIVLAGIVWAFSKWRPGGIFSSEDQQNSSLNTENVRASGNIVVPGRARGAAASVAAIEDKVLAVPVLNNSLEYNLKAELYENAEEETFLRVEYYLNSSSKAREFSIADIPQMNGILKGYGVGKNKIDASVLAESLQISLNPVFSKVFISISAKDIENEPKTALYLLDMEKTDFKMIFSAPEAFLLQKPVFTNDYSRVVFKFLNENGDVITNWEFDCSNRSKSETRIPDNTKAVATASPPPADTGKTPEESVTGEQKEDSQNTGPVSGTAPAGESSNGNSGEESSPTLNTNTDVKEETAVNEATNTDVEEDPVAATDPLTDESSTYQEQSEPAAEDEKESEAVGTLKKFYACLSDPARYQEGMELLDESFTISLRMFKNFGIDFITKKDIETEGVGVYSALLQKSVLDSIEKEELRADTATIHYYHVFSGMSSASPEVNKLALVAKLINTKEGWRLLSVTENE